MNIKKTNISAILSAVMLFVFLVQQKGLLPPGFKPWIDVLLEFGAYMGIGGTAIGLGSKFRKGEAILKDKKPNKFVLMDKVS